jgi:hypothetical protein
MMDCWWTRVAASRQETLVDVGWFTEESICLLSVGGRDSQESHRDGQGC